MLSSPDLTAALERGIRYSRIVSDGAEVSLSRLTEGCGIEVEYHAEDRAAPRQRCEFILLSLMTFLRWISGRELRPQVVEFRHPTPLDLQP